MREKQHLAEGVELELGNEVESNTMGYRTWMTSTARQDDIIHGDSRTAKAGALPSVRMDMPNVRECYHSMLNTKKSREGSQLHWDTVFTLGAVLDLSTHLYNYPTPLAPELARFVVADKDLYIPRDHISSVRHTWPGKEC